jgi:hypothetical protein
MPENATEKLPWFGSQKLTGPAANQAFSGMLKSAFVITL